MPETITPVDIALGTILARIDTTEKSLNELHTRSRENAKQIDHISLHTDDMKNRLIIVEKEYHQASTRSSETLQRVELLESKLDDMRSNLKKVIEGQMDILNSNANTREQFSAVLASKDKQHSTRMKTLRTIVYIGGGLAILATQIYARWDGHQTLIDMLVNLFMGGVRS